MCERNGEIERQREREKERQRGSRKLLRDSPAWDTREVDSLS